MQINIFIKIKYIDEISFNTSGNCDNFKAANIDDKCNIKSIIIKNIIFWTKLNDLKNS
ncbi:hypothetical protein P9202_614 [Prochlorococcus marinus str. MIT 9202]|nr:hypothetical protein P9202_614 [Prochlorococcus marinus str. MIT 9202]